MVSTGRIGKMTGIQVGGTVEGSVRVVNGKVEINVDDVDETTGGTIVNGHIDEMSGLQLGRVVNEEW